MSELKELGIHWGTDKVNHGYIDVYHELFSPLKNNNNNFLEIGVWRGASIGMWSQYFSNSYIVGVDVPVEIKQNTIYPYSIEDSRKIEEQLGNVSIVHGDSASESTITEIMDVIEKHTNRREFDIIIDDGSHFQHDIMVGLGYMFTHLTSGGIYVIEDICSEEDLINGSQWWGHSKETHHVGGFHSDEVMLAGPEVNIENCVSRVMKEFEKTGIMNSKYLTEEQNSYLTENVCDFVRYPAMTAPIKCESEIVVLHKR